MDIDDMWDDEEDLQQFSRVIQPRIPKGQSEVSTEYAEINRLRQQLATLTEQRDLAVEALARTRNMIRNYPDAAENCANDALAAIQSSEVTNHMKGVE